MTQEVLNIIRTLEYELKNTPMSEFKRKRTKQLLQHWYGVLGKAQPRTERGESTGPKPRRQH